MANSVGVAVVEKKRAPGVPAQAGVKWARMATEEYGAELRKAPGPHPTRKYRATEPRLGRTTPDNRGPPPNSMSLRANRAHEDPVTKTPAAGKPSDGGAAWSPRPTNKAAGTRVTHARRSPQPRTTGRAMAARPQPRNAWRTARVSECNNGMEFSAKKSEQNKMKARFAKDRSQDTAPSATKKGVKLVVEQQDKHYANVSASPPHLSHQKRQSRRPWAS